MIRISSGTETPKIKYTLTFISSSAQSIVEGLTGSALVHRGTFRTRAPCCCCCCCLRFALCGKQSFARSCCFLCQYATCDLHTEITIPLGKIIHAVVNQLWRTASQDLIHVYLLGKRKNRIIMPSARRQEIGLNSLLIRVISYSLYRRPVFQTSYFKFPLIPKTYFNPWMWTRIYQEWVSNSRDIFWICFDFVCDLLAYRLADCLDSPNIGGGLGGRCLGLFRLDKLAIGGRLWDELTLALCILPCWDRTSPSNS
jgi:hypothetical protein